jgi:hypothetical protein
MYAQQRYSSPRSDVKMAIAPVIISSGDNINKEVVMSSDDIVMQMKATVVYYCSLKVLLKI